MSERISETLPTADSDIAAPATKTFRRPIQRAPKNERYYSDPLLSAVLGSAAHISFPFFFVLSPSTLGRLGYGNLTPASVK